jgi:molecular chaperone GrpE
MRDRTTEAPRRGGNESALVPVRAATREDALRREIDNLHSRLGQTEVRLERVTAAWARQIRERRTAAARELIAALLPTLDSLWLAARSVRDDSPVCEGLAIVYRELAHTLASFGLVTHSPRVGEAFDPHFEEAISYEEHPGVADGAIVEVIREGQSLGGQLLRPALVSVARAVVYSGGVNPS